MLGELEYTVLPTCPVCGEVTYKEEDLKILIKNATKKGYLIADADLMSRVLEKVEEK